MIIATKTAKKVQTNLNHHRMMEEKKAVNMDEMVNANFKNTATS